ncbi:MAG: DUF192 domain-containing protein [Micavibrio sp.]|nr:DUF192 domain-containing protein [Micavibrio sp.]
MKNFLLQFYKPVIIAAVCAAVIIGGYMVSGDGEQAGAAVSSKLPIETVIFDMQSGHKETFDVEVASKPVDLEIGLMFRSSMPKGHGMLFEMGTPAKPTSFWMKNTLIPLDIIYIGADGGIVNIHHNAVPKDLTSIPSGAPVTGVIELNGGRADEIGLRVGDRVLHPYFSQAAEK